MGGAAEFPERAASPLKRRASSMDPEVDTDGDGNNEDVDMVAPPPLAPAQQSSNPSKSTDQDQSHGDVEGTTPSITMADGIFSDPGGPDRFQSSQANFQCPAPQMPASVEGHFKSIKALYDELQSRPLQEGEVGYIVSRKWLSTVIGDERDPNYAKVAANLDPRLIDPVDNSDIIWEVIEDPTVGKTADPIKRNFVRLKAGMVAPIDFDIFPPAAWELLIQWPGLAAGQLPIVRKAYRSSDDDSDSSIKWDMSPPVLTIHRLWSEHSPIPIKQIIKQRNPPPVKLVRSRNTPWKQFLAQAKKETDIELKDKIRVWFIPHNISAGGPGASVVPPPPPASSDVVSDPSNPQHSWTHMLLDVTSFTDLQRDVQRYLIKQADATHDTNYNGKLTIGADAIGLTTDMTVVLDERIEGVQYVSNSTPSDTAEKPSAVRSSSTSLAVSSKNRSGRTSPALSGPVTRGRAQKSGRQIGCVGLSNLGNTCYMNAALQCVRSVEELTKYFLSEEWVKEINKDNPLGHNGQVASAYAALLHDFYKDPAPGSITPRHFKNTIGRYAHAFSGYGQQDSQEFLGFLLDGLQEDLSRIKKKPYIEKPDSTDDMINNPAAIREMADKVWDITKKRDDSVIADLFTGLYQSTLVCPDPDCAKVSITFDPFNNLTLPLPVESKWQHEVRFFPLNDKPIIIDVEIEKNGSIRRLKEFISSKVGVPVERLHGAEEWKGKFYKQHSNGSCASEEIAKNDNLWMYELEAAPTNWNAAEIRKAQNGKAKTVRSMIDDAEPRYSELRKKMLVPVVHRRQASRRGLGGGGRQFETVGMPHFIILDPEESYSEDIIRRKVLQKVATVSKHSIFSRQEDFEASDATDPEIVGTSGSDFGSNEGKVMAQSVEGEDDIVDVTMKDAAVDVNASSQGAGSSQSRPAKYMFNKTKPVWLDPNKHLPPELQNLFELKYWHDNNAIVPTGMSTVDADNHPSLSERAPEPASPAEDGLDNVTNGTISDDDSSSGGTSRPSVDLAPTRMADESSDDGVPAPQGIAHRPKNTRPITKIGGARKKGKTYGKKGNKRQQRQMAAANRKQQQQQQQLQRQQEREDAQVPTAGSEAAHADGDGGLVRLHEGIIVDWADEAFEMIIGDGLTMIEQCEVLADPALEKARQARTKRSKHGITLDNCLDEFEREEVLSEQDTWYCPRCKQHQRATKKFDLWKTPDILIVHLKRFSSSGYHRNKIEILVDFPLEGLDLTHRVLNKENGKEEVYDLIGVDCHWGGLGGGHYTAHGKNFIDNQWYQYNDSQVSKSSAERIVDSSAYLLFYRRRSTVPLGGPRFKEIIDAYRNAPSDDEGTGAGEGRRLGEASSLTGSSSALQEQEAGATRQPATGTGGNGSGSYNHSVQPSIESDEGIDMTGDSQPSNAYMSTWSFKGLNNEIAAEEDDNVAGSPLVGSDEAQHDSSGDERFDDLPGVDQFEVGPMEGSSEPPTYSDPPPPPPPYALAAEDLHQIWDKRQIIEVPAELDDQRSDGVHSIHLEDEDKVKSE